MGFVTPALLGGALLVGLPIMLHLVMRREAKQLQFPALRFVQRRRTLNQHRLRLRHLLLLALRCAIIALLAAALARPMLRGSGMAGKEGKPVATVLLFDNSLRMQYQHENQSRLERAKELGRWLVEQLPADSPVAVIDRAGRQRGQDLDRDAAELRIERLELSAVVRPPEEPLRDAADWLRDKPEHRGEIYVFTDLSAEAWPDAMLAEFARRLDELPGANVYLIDVGVERPQNVGLAPLRLSSQQLGPGGLLQIDSHLLRSGTTAANGSTEAGEGTADAVNETVVELYAGTKGSAAEKRGQLVLTASADVPAPVEFSLSGLKMGTHQGYLRIMGGDALPCDDIRYFTVDVRPPSDVLLLGEKPTDTVFLRQALAPTVAGQPLPSKFHCEEGRFSQLGELNLSKYDAVCLADPSSLPAAAWQSLVRFVEAGGGLGVFLGRRAARDELNASEPQQLLPAQLRWISREPTFLRPVAVEHPALAELRDLVDVAPWSEFPVFQYWELDAGAEDAHVVAPYANGKPGLVERRVGRGRVLMLTTSLSDAAHDDPWNLLATGPEPWPFLALADGVAKYLAGTGDEQLNYLAGQTAVLRLSADEPLTSYVVQIPGTGAVRTSSGGLSSGEPDLSIASTDALGNYRIQAGGQKDRLDRGFSINCSPQMSQLERTTPERIANVLGKDRVRVARTREEIEVRVGQGRLGRELFPALIVAVALVLAAEQLLANRFYWADVSK
ncbi:MAG: BatA domain-containing protein [Pirellulales bacterium]